MSFADVFLMLAGLMGGLAMFLFGMNLMSESLTNITGNGLRNLIERVTRKKITGYLFGTGITAIVQSSSTTTVMVVGFVNAGVMTLLQAVNVILGANLGTTATAWLLSLNSIEGESFVMLLIKPANLAPFLAVGAVFFSMFTKSESKKRICNIIIGFSLLMLGMSAMSTAMKPLGALSSFQNLLVSFENPVLGYLVAVVFTMIVQSCDATVGIVQALALTVGVPYATCIPLICGVQLGTCITSIISSIGGSRNGRRAAFLHLFYNIFKTGTFLAVFYTIDSFVHFSFLSASASLVGIALIHSMINIIYSVIVLPLSGALVRLVYLVLPKTESERDIDEVMSLLNPILLKTAPIAITQAKIVTDRISDLVSGIFEDIRRALTGIEVSFESFGNKTDLIEIYADKLSDYTVKIGLDSLSIRDSRRLMLVKDAANDYSMIIKEFRDAIQTIKSKKDDENFSIPDDYKDDIAVFYEAMEEIIAIVNEGYRNNNPAFVKAIPTILDITYDMQNKIIRKSVNSVHDGELTYEQQFFINDIIQYLGRIVGCLDDIGRALNLAYPPGKKTKLADRERETKVIEGLFRDKYEKIAAS
ncbi:MAG: Na/Pi cotransporter family protein [Eubacterium sp.]|nr:Na/Pi cotransporter family protein [Eubacterium sp.]